MRLYKTALGWVRGRICGKIPGFVGRYFCELCGRTSNDKMDLCFPVRPTTK